MISFKHRAEETATADITFGKRCCISPQQSGFKFFREGGAGADGTLQAYHISKGSPFLIIRVYKHGVGPIGQLAELYQATEVKQKEVVCSLGVGHGRLH